MGLQVPELVSSWATVKQPLGVTCVSYCEKKKARDHYYVYLVRGNVLNALRILLHLILSNSMR